MAKAKERMWQKVSLGKGVMSVTSIALIMYLYGSAGSTVDHRLLVLGFK